MIPRSDTLWARGVSSAPWEDFSHGIFVFCAHDEWTLPHEIGHYFGLLHVFYEDDFVDDTPFQEDKYCVDEEDATPNCKNAMGYCSHLPKKVTPGQIERMKRFLRATRADHIILDEDDISISIKETFDHIKSQFEYNLPYETSTNGKNP